MVQHVYELENQRAAQPLGKVDVFGDRCVEVPGRESADWSSSVGAGIDAQNWGPELVENPTWIT